jgi:hypothetical protein
VLGAVVAGLVLPRGDLKTLASENQTAKVEPEIEETPPRHVCRVRVACR